MYKAKKNLGQNFLEDKVVLQEIIDSIKPYTEDDFLEIGPGKGSLTELIVGSVNTLNVVELDRDLILGLKLLGHKKSNLTIHNENILDFKIDEISNSKKFTSNLIGSHNYENIVSALSIGKYFGVSEENAAKEISKFSLHDNRSQLIRFNSNTIILDAYNANPVSMKYALEILSKFDKYKIAILGDMLELGKISKTEHAGIGRFVSNLKLDQVYYVGSRMKNAYLTDNNSFWFNNKSDLESELNKIQIKDSVVLLKGSRSLMLESLVPLIKKIST